MEFKVTSLNVNSIVNCGRKFLLNEFIATNPAHVFLIQETKFGDRHNYTFPRFSTFLSTRSIGAGGVLMMIHDGIKIRNLRTITGKIDGVFVDIFLGIEWITIGSVYVSPTCNDITPLTRLLSNCNH